MRHKILLLLCFLFLGAYVAKADWVAGNTTIAPAAPVPACSTLTVSGTFTWTGFTGYSNSTSFATLNFALPGNAVVTSTGTPLVIDQATSLPVANVVYTLVGNTWQATFDAAQMFTVFQGFVFSVSGMTVVDTTISGQTVTNFITFASAPAGDVFANNASSTNLSTVATPTITAASDTICVGATTQLTGSGTAATTDPWTSSDTLIATVDNSGLVTGVSAGTSTITYTDDNGCSVDTIITVSAPPVTATATPSAMVCIGDSVTLTGGGATTYAWDNGVMDGVIFAPAVTTTYTVTGTDATSGCSATTSITVTVNQFPTFTVSAMPDTVCPGSPTQLNTTPQFSNSYILTSAPYAPTTPTGTVDTLADNGTAIVPLTTGSLDDGRWNSIALPFAFDYFGTTYNDFSVSTNGFLSFVPLTTNFANVGMPNTGNPNAYIALASEDLDLDGAPVAGGTLDYFTEGIAPNRKFVLRYTNVDIFGTTSGPNVTTEVVLNETTNTIEMHVTQVAPLAGNGMTMGVEGPNGLFATTIPGRNDESPFTATNEGWLFTPPTNAGSTVWSPAATLNDANIPNPIASPLATTFYVASVTQNGCTTSDSVEVTVITAPAVTATAASATICEGDTAMLTASGADTFSWNPGALSGAMVSVVPTVSPTDYIVTGTDTTTGCTAMDTVTISFFDPTYVLATADVDSICAGDMVNLMAMDSIVPLAFCQSAFTNVSFEHITNVDYESISNASAGVTGGPVDFTTQVANVTVGTPDTLSVTILADFSEYVYAWIDWNQNGDFTDAGEQYTVASNVGTNGPHEIIITPPAGALNGNTRMRVMNDWDNATPDPCRSATYGEAEDYTVNVSGGVTVAPPTYTYAWMPGSLIGAPQTVTPAATTNYIVTQTDSATGCEATDSVEVFVKPTPTLAVSATPSATVCLGDTVTLMSGALNYDSLTWNGIVTAGTDTVLAPATTGTYTVMAIDTASGCSVMDSVMVLVNTPLPMDSVVATMPTICEGDTVGLQAYPGLLPPTAHCTSVFNNTGDTKIDSTNINGVATFTPGIPGAAEVYTDYTSVIVPVTAGTAFPFAVTKGSASTSTYSSWVKVYIDLDQNNTFDLPGEEFVNAAAGAFGSGAFTVPANITIPTTAFNGQTRMRIVLRETPTASEVTPCGPYPDWGETEDYILDITGGTPPPPPMPGFASISWNPTANLSPTTGDVVSAQGVTATTTFIATGIDANGCESMDSTTVMINPLPIVMASVMPTTALCPGDTAMLAATSPTATTFAWEPGTLVGANQSVAPATTTNYIASGTDANGCVGTVSVAVNVNPMVALTVTIDSLESCIGTMDGGATATAPGAPIVLFSEGFESYSGLEITSDSSNIPTLTNNWSYTQSIAGGRVRFNAGAGFYNTGGAAATMDRNPSGAQTINYLITETDLSANAADPLTLSFWFAHHGEESHVNDRVWVRGSSTDAWVQAYDWYANRGGTGTFVQATVDLTAVLTGAGQTPSATTGIRFGQEDNFPATSTTASDGFTVDDIEITTPSSNSLLWSTTDTTNSITGVGVGTYTVTATDVNGCMATDSAVIVAPTLSGDLTQATAGNTASNAGTQSDTLTQPNDGVMYSYFDSTCAIIASVTVANSGNNLGLVTTTATIEATVPVHNTQPFVPRWFQIVTTNQSVADVTLYVTQDDFNDYNVYATANGWPLLPADSVDAAGIANLVITKNDDGGLGVNPIVLTPTSVVWDSPNQRWEVLVATPSFSQFRLHSVNPLNAALEVEYKDFTVTKQATTDLVEWTTVNEENSNYFNVQRSLDGSVFETLGTVKSKAVNGLSSAELNYSYIDADPQIGHNYYRLEHVGMDNETSYTEVVDIIWGSAGSVVSIYPNPTRATINIDLSTNNVSITEVKLLDMSGRVVKSVTAQTTKGLNNIQMDLSEIANGVYGIQIFENNKLTHNSKLTKKN